MASFHTFASFSNLIPDLQAVSLSAKTTERSAGNQLSLQPLSVGPALATAMAPMLHSISFDHYAAAPGLIVTHFAPAAPTVLLCRPRSVNTFSSETSSQDPPNLIDGLW